MSTTLLHRRRSYVLEGVIWLWEVAKIIAVLIVAFAILYAVHFFTSRKSKKELEAMFEEDHQRMIESG